MLKLLCHMFPNKRLKTQDTQAVKDKKQAELR